jgi:tetratricopeptide (TPR) repeat protein
VIYELGPLAIPDIEWDREELLNIPSCRLFVDRASTSSPQFRLTPQNSRDVAQLCVRLDGLPLAIELAASQIRAFSPGEIIALLNEQLTTQGQPDQVVAGRYHTLRESLLWSYDLLSQAERQLFERCSVFRGHFRYDAVLETLCYPPLQPADIAALLPGLVDKSLISARREGEFTEYRMLDSVRQFAFSLLAQRGESDYLQGQYAQQLLHLGASMLQDLQGRNQIYALQWFHRNWVDVRSCMDWSLKSGNDELAWDFLGGIGTGWEILGAKGELFDWLGVLLTRPMPGGIAGVKAEVATTFLLDYQDTEKTLVHAERARQLAGQLSDESSAALAELSLGWALNYSNPDSATEHLLRADRLFRQRGDEWHHALALEALGQAEGSTNLAVDLLMKSAEAFGRLGDYVKRANCLNQMANHAVSGGARTSEARQWLDEAERLAYRTGNHHEQLHAQLFRVRLEQCEGPAPAHGPRLEKLLKDFRLLGDQRCVCRSLLSLGYESVQSGSFRTADRQLADSVTLAANCGATQEMATGIHLLAESSFRSGRPETAAAFLGASEMAWEHLRRKVVHVPPTDAGLNEVLRTHLGPEAYAAATAVGRETPITELLPK